MTNQTTIQELIDTLAEARYMEGIHHTEGNIATAEHHRAQATTVHAAINQRLMDMATMLTAGTTCIHGGV